MFLGGDDFLSRLRSKLNDTGKEDLSEVPRLQRRVASKPLEWYVRNVVDSRKAMTLAHGRGDFTMKEIAEAFGVHYAAISQAVKRFEGMHDCKS